MSLVRSAGVNQATNTTISRTYSTHAGGAPTAGNLLIACVSINVTPSSHTPPGWNEIQTSPLGSGNTFGSWYYKISDGTEDTVTWSWAGSSTATLVITEWNDAVTTLDSSNEDVTDISTIVTTYDTGTATASESAGLAIAMFTADSGLNVDGGRAYNNSFVEDVASFAAASARGGVFLASKAISATGSYSCQYTTTDTGDEGYGSIALFVTPSGGSFQAAWARGSNVIMGTGAR